MIAIVSVLVIVTLSLLVTRVASVALVHTGMGRESARFQARSAFTGVGFTTTEAESVVSHPVRRRIVMLLMLVGNAGIIAAVSSMLLSLLNVEDGIAGARQLGVLFGGLMLLWWLSASKWVDARLCTWITAALARYTDIDTRDYARLLHLREDYGVSELLVQDGDWLAGRRLDEVDVDDEGVLVLGIECPGANFIGAPRGDVEVHAGGRLVVYGRMAPIAVLDRRVHGPEGDHAHRTATDEQRSIASREEAGAGRA